MSPLLKLGNKHLLRILFHSLQSPYSVSGPELGLSRPSLDPHGTYMLMMQTEI